MSQQTTRPRGARAWFSADSGTRRLNFIAAVLSFGWVLLISMTLSPSPDDFKQYRQAAVNLRVTGDPYLPPPGQEATAYRGYYYPPLFAYLIQPLASLSQAQGQLLWFWLNAAASVAFALLSIRLSGATMARRYWGIVILAFLLMPPVRLNLQLGQVSVFTGLLMVGAAALSGRRAAAAGLLLALVALTRVFPAAIGLPLLLWGRLRAILWGAAWGLAVVAVSLALYGVGPYISFLEYAQAPLEPYPFAAEHNISLYGMFSRVLAPSRYTAAPVADLPWLIGPLVVVCSAGVLAFCLWRGQRADTPGEPPISLGLWLCGIMLLSTTNGTYMLALLLVPFLAILRRLELAPDRRLLLALAICTGLAVIPPGWTGVSHELYLLTHTGWGLLLLTPALYGLAGYLVLLGGLARPRVSGASQ